MIAALYVEPGGAYYGLPGVDPWDQARDARLYAGPWPVVAHPPCERWGRFWHGSPRNPHQFKLGDDGGCFALALAAVRRFGGVLEHPADSHAFKAFGLNVPPRSGGGGLQPIAWAARPAMSNKAFMGMRRGNPPGFMRSGSRCRHCAGAVGSNACTPA
jgi:hypothetical protein